MNVPTPTSVPEGSVDRPGFATEHLAVEVKRATELVCEELPGLTATDTDEGITLRTTGGMLIAVLAGREAETELHYRTAPASESATLKARRVWRVLRPYAA